ncbi:MAG: 16S rRNA (guanine(966)-N(2))-methyltransferase RsmD [Candidatus Omnitrophica bacterium]|nr:16S rRNA (guanine(966)-N(2))-methyltransferase RsmD [Candidatus Omnitrophota bacterium]
MRIISGKYKGRTVQMPSGIRPTQQRVRKALFDILGDMQGLSFLELFAGSAAVGFEAKSYGAKEVFLVENNSLCLETIRKNISSLGDSGYQVIGLDAGAAIKKLNREGKLFDIIFVDAPYHKGKIGEESLSKRTLQIISAYDILAELGFVVIQHFKKDILPDALGDLHLFRQSQYGDTSLSFYRKREV